MLTRSRIVKTIIAVALLIFFVRCRHEIPYPDGSENGNSGGSAGSTSTCDPDTVYFQTSILPLINAGCAQSGCHDAITKKEGVQLTDYSHIKKYVVPFKPGSSKLFKVLTASGSDRMPPAPQPSFSAADRALIEKWISQGALNNSCTAGCDTSLYTYSAAIAPMMKTYCVGCHGPNNTAGAGIELNSYTTVKLVADNGQLIGSIQHDAGYAAMPQGGNKLSDCQISQVQKWIDSGAPNN